MQALYHLSRQPPLLCHKATRCFASKTGTVKFYIRTKGYGFLVPDGGGADIFVHRHSLFPGNKEVKDISVQHPYLRIGERVMYDLSSDGGGQPQAVNVTWLNGRSIPLLRATYLAHVHERAKQTLGEHCYTILKDLSLDDAAKFDKVKDAYAHFEHMIQSAEQLILRMGLKVENFPTEHGSRSVPNDEDDETSAS